MLSKHSIFMKVVALLMVLFMVVCLTGCMLGGTDATQSSLPSETTATTIDETEGVTEPTVETEAPTEPADPTDKSQLVEESTEEDPAVTTEPAQEEFPQEEQVALSAVTYSEVNETVYATSSVNIRTGPGTEYKKLGMLATGHSILRIGIGDNGWSQVVYDDSIAYIRSSYLSATVPVSNTSQYPLTYSDSSCNITITKEWYENAWCYIAHLQFSDYSRFGTSCANGSYNNGYETTSHAAGRLGAIFAVNGCYSAPYLNYTVVRSGVLCNGSGKNLWTPAVYSSSNGLLQSAWETGGTPGIAGVNVDSLVEMGLVTDTFCFGPPILVNGSVSAGSDTSRAQRTFIGTNGNAGDIWVVVSEGRNADGESSGLTHSQCARLLAEKGCIFGVPLDGGGSSTMVFQGKVLNSAKAGQRSVVDFVYFK